MYIWQSGFAAMGDGFGHAVETSHFVSQVSKREQIAAGTDAALDEPTRRREMPHQLTTDELAFGEMPPIGTFDCDQLVEVFRIHGPRIDIELLVAVTFSNRL